MDLPEWVHGKVGVIRFLPIQGHYNGVPCVNEDVGASLDQSHRRAWHHLNPYSVVTIHHTIDNLDLQSNYTVMGSN